VRPGPALAGLLAGATLIAFAPLFVRFSDVGPTATGAWRVLLSLPLLAGLARGRARPAPGTSRGLLALAGLAFAGDLFVWHLAIEATTVANATLFANFAPIVVTLGAWRLLGERITGGFVLGLLTALAGTVLVVGAHGVDDPALARTRWAGDALGLATAVFYGAYQLAVKRLRERVDPATLLLRAGLVTGPVLAVLAALRGEALWPRDGQAWLVLVALAWLSHVGGQGMIAWSLRGLPASFSSVALLWQPPAAAALAFVLLGETLTPTQGLGAVVVLAGLLVARRAQLAPSR